MDQDPEEVLEEVLVLGTELVLKLALAARMVMASAQDLDPP